jgi:predicted enzyme related to lactoylglutathione lyase
VTKPNVREMFFSVPVADVDRARQFYVGALDGTVLYQSGVILAEAADTEGNVFTLSLAPDD